MQKEFRNELFHTPYSLDTDNAPELIRVNDATDPDGIVYLRNGDTGTLQCVLSLFDRGLGCLLALCLVVPNPCAGDLVYLASRIYLVLLAT